MPDCGADYRILVAGKELDIDPRHLTGLTVTDSLGEISKCEFTVSDSHDFVLTPAMLALKMTVEVWMGYIGDLVKVFAGEIVEINPDFAQSGTPVLNIVAFDPAYRLKRTIYANRIWSASSILSTATYTPIVAGGATATYGMVAAPPVGLGPLEGTPLPAMSPTALAASAAISAYDIIRDIVKNPVIKYPFELVMSPEKPLRDYVYKDGQSEEQNNESDMDVLARFAERQNYQLYAKFGMGGLNPARQYLYFVRDEYLLSLQTVEYRMFYNCWPEQVQGTDIKLLRFSPSINQFDIRGMFEISNWITNKSTDVYAKSDIKEAMSSVLKGFGDMFAELGKMVRLVDSKAETDYQAKEITKAKLQRMINNLVKGDASIDGNARLQPGQRHEIVLVGLGDHGKEYSGDYFVTSVTHAIKEDGFTTNFNVRRMGGTKR